VLYRSYRFRRLPAAGDGEREKRLQQRTVLGQYQAARRRAEPL
jgi:hypothetical protein